MSQTNIVMTQLAQLGLAERTAQEMQGHPEVTRQAAQQAAPEALKQLRESVVKTEDAESSRGIKAGKDGGKGRGGAREQKRRKGAPSPEENEHSSAPWAGNIVNLKV
jgi:hypothetical protein